MSSAPSPPPESTAAATAEAAWQVTFADLAALLLSFFVLVFAMSTMDEERWSALSSALVERQVPGDRVPAPPPVRRLTAPKEASADATSPDYLYALLRRRLDRGPLLVPVTLERAPDAVLVRFDAGLIVHGERPAPAAQGRLLLAQLVAMLAPLENAVSLRLRPAAAAAGERDDGRAGGLRAAAAAAQVLRAAGFRRPLAVYALSPEAGSPAGRATVEMVVHREAAGG
ncbi:MAG TPA: flagellar motor protein MotB [Geminicoccaceae bacterium]|nr:flagellar motor protein MotB [Geminicoccaceae bacterium]